MMKLNGAMVVAEVIGQQCQCQLRRAAATVAPLKSGRTVIPQVEPGIERTAIDSNVSGITFTSPFVTLHDAPPIKSCTSSKERCSGCVPGSSNRWTLTKQNFDSRTA